MTLASEVAIGPSLHVVGQIFSNAGAIGVSDAKPFEFGGSFFDTLSGGGQVRIGPWQRRRLDRRHNLIVFDTGSRRAAGPCHMLRAPMAKQLWVVRAGRDGIYIEDFLNKKMVAIGWSSTGDMTGFHTREQVAEVLARDYPEYTKFQLSMNTGQVLAFCAISSRAKRS